eukprot:3967677-Pleurochrysis_carterae.AAC.1
MLTGNERAARRAGSAYEERTRGRAAKVEKVRQVRKWGRSARLRRTRERQSKRVRACVLVCGSEPMHREARLGVELRSHVLMRVGGAAFKAWFAPHGVLALACCVCARVRMRGSGRASVRLRAYGGVCVRMRVC